MKNVLVLGAAGMLGRYVTRYLNEAGMNATGLGRSEFDAYKLSSFELTHYYKPDVIVNCIGIINKDVDTAGIMQTIHVNAWFPHELAKMCDANNIQLIHITTDCVFSGKLGNYTEAHLHDALDVYGKTKSLGEPSTSMNIRTSIIGEEIGLGKSLISWVKSNRYKEVYGYDNHLWNGITCLELAKFIEKSITNEKYWEGTRHIFSPSRVSKYELVSLISEILEVPLKIVPTSTPVSIDRTLKTIHSIEISTSLHQQITDLKGYFEP